MTTLVMYRITHKVTGAFEAIVPEDALDRYSDLAFNAEEVGWATDEPSSIAAAELDPDIEVAWVNSFGVPI